MGWLSSVQILIAAFIVGFVAAAPLGPVNMVAIRRGIIGRWTHTLACGIGSAGGDLLLFALVLLAGNWLLPDPSHRPAWVDTTLSLIGALLLLPLGSYFFYKAFANPLQAYARARRSLRGAPPRHLIADVATGSALTLINPLSVGYWVLQTNTWLPGAQKALGAAAPWWGLAFAGAGLMTWFTILTFFVRFMPDRLGPGFFRAINIISGLILIAFGVAAACFFVHHAFFQKAS